MIQIKDYKVERFIKESVRKVRVPMSEESFIKEACERYASYLKQSKLMS